MSQRLCRLCGERHVCPSRMRAHDYRCSYCRYRNPSQRAAVARYDRSPRGRANKARSDVKRIWIGRQYHSRAKTAETARMINAHIRERRLAFIKGQQDRKETEGPATGRVSTEATI